MKNKALIYNRREFLLLKKEKSALSSDLLFYRTEILLRLWTPVKIVLPLPKTFKENVWGTSIKHCQRKCYRQFCIAKLCSINANGTRQLLFQNKLK